MKVIFANLSLCRQTPKWIKGTVQAKKNFIRSILMKIGTYMLIENKMG